MKRKLAGLTAVLAVLLVVVSTAVAAAPIFPTVTSTYQPYTENGVSGYDFIYTVTHAGGTNAFNFGYLQIDTAVPTAAGTDGWVLYGPFSNGSSVDANWANGITPGWYDDADVEYNSAFWRAIGTQEVLRAQTWTGVFILHAPNCTPTKGSILTKDGVITSTNVTEDMDVPGLPAADIPDVPEPGSMLALASGLIGLFTFISRRVSG